METNSEDNSEELTTNSLPFDFQRFDFLDKCLKQSKEELGFKTNKIQITCFDVNQNFFVFGSNCGLIYCFRRHVSNSEQFFKYRLFSSSISLIKLITDELLSFVTESGVYVWNRLSHKFLYGWKCPTKALITCLQTFMSINDQKLLVLSGDTDGIVRFHDLMKCQQNPVFKDFGFQIIQIQFIDSRTLLISTSFKTVIVKINFSDPNQQKIISVGKNQRKTYGKFGAVFSQTTGLIYGSRPSLHLIKANINGDVIETIRINNIQESDTNCSQTLEEFIQKPITGKVVYKLGTLQLFCNDQFVISINDSNLLIVRTDGQFCIKEKVDKLVDLKISAANSNEAFLLLQSNHIIRIQNNQMKNCVDSESSSEYEKSTESESKSTDSKSSNESVFNLMRGPTIVNSISFIDEELKKVFDFTAIQNKLSKKYNQLSASIISTIDPKILPNSDKNVFVSTEYDNSANDSIDANSPELMTPLVVTRKGRRRIRHNSSDSLMTVNSTTDSVNSNEEVVPKMITQNTETKLLTDNKVVENGESNDDRRLEMILSAFREANGLGGTEPQTEELVIEDNQLSNGIQLNLTSSQETKSEERQEEPKSSKSHELTDIGIDSQTEQMRVESTKSANSVEEVANLCWQQMIRLYETRETKSRIFLSIHSFGYNSDSEIGLIWFVTKDSESLVYFPSFDSLKLSKGCVRDITSLTYELYVLNDSGFIFRREGMNATKPIGTKWSQIKGNKSRFKLTSISFNPNHSILWCCDSNGETWTLQIKNQKWVPIKDFSSHSIEMKKVCVSPSDPTIVWGIDKNGKVFVRSFLKSGDNRNDFCGDEWLLMDGILAIDIVVCCDNTVLIADLNNQLLRRSDKIGPNDKINEWKAVNAPEVPKDDSFISLSVTENNDFMIMTAKGSVWHTFSNKKRHSAKEDLDWLLI